MELELFSTALQIALLSAAPVAIAVLLGGICAGLLQTITQVSDESIGFGIRLAAAVVAVLFFSQFMLSEVEEFSRYAWTAGLHGH